MKIMESDSMVVLFLECINHFKFLTIAKAKIGNEEKLEKMNKNIRQKTKVKAMYKFWIN